MRMPHEDVDALMEEASARIVLPRFGRLASGDIDEKKANDFVTIADREAEEFLAPRLAALLPGARVLGEEAASADPSLMGRVAAEGLLWVIDPIDGTRSFIDRRDDFGIIVALLRDGETIGGWIMQPRGGRRLATERGAGTRLWGHAPSAPREAGALPLGMFLGRLPDGARARDRAEGRFDVGPRPGGGAIAFLEVAAGGADLLYLNRGWPWDHAAGVLALCEDGGEARFLADGAAYSPRRWNEPILVTREAARWQATRALLDGPVAG